MVMPLYVLFFNCNINVDTQNVQTGIFFVIMYFCKKIKFKIFLQFFF